MAQLAFGICEVGGEALWVDGCRGDDDLNIDFLLGYLKRLLPKRPDLKVIITTATIDPERFATHFADAEGNPAPIIESDSVAALEAVEQLRNKQSKAVRSRRTWRGVTSGARWRLPA